jgi:hypothetical protein
MNQQNKFSGATIFGFGLALLLTTLPAGEAAALSCLPVEEYVQDVVGDESTFIFKATSVDRIDENDYTAEVLRVTESLQGYTPNSTFVYHTKDETWGYFCNLGPGTKGSSGIYIATQDAFGKYQVSQRLPEDSEILPILKEALLEKKISGEVYTIEKIDRMNQIKTIITDTLKELQKLLREYAYWK